MRNVQRTSRFGGATEHEETDERECRSNATERGKIAATAATGVALNSNPAALLAKGAGAARFVEVAQHDLFVQQPGLQDCWAGESETMQVRAET